MKRIIVSFVLVAGLTAGVAVAQQAHPAQKAAKPAAEKTVTGELVDMGCYVGHGAKGEKHVDCATSASPTACRWAC